MKLTEFRVRMYRSLIDSGPILVDPLTVIVGKNESGKTSLLRALHKLNPFGPDPYDMKKEWPRGRRTERDPSTVVCAARFVLSDIENQKLVTLTGADLPSGATVEATRNFRNDLVVSLEAPHMPGMARRAPGEVDRELAGRQLRPTQPVGVGFGREADAGLSDLRTESLNGFDGVDETAIAARVAQFTAHLSPEGSPERATEEAFIAAYPAQVKTLMNAVGKLTPLATQVRALLQQWLPTFVYMSDYRAFKGSAKLDEVQGRFASSTATEEDKTLLMLMKLSGLDLAAEVAKASDGDPSQRQYDLSDASRSLTRIITDRFRQQKYTVDFRSDGQHFLTFVSDERDPSLIELEERSKGFQWFFSFDLMLMHESNGTFKGCVILLDEPGLHLHPDAQKDLLRRLESYANDNVLIYSTHLPFMIDLRKPERIRVLTEADGANTVTEDLTKSQPEAKLVLQAALGMSASTSYLVAERNLVVEGVDDFWIISELSNLLERSGEKGLPEDVLITPAGGASEAAYMATFMIAQKLKVTVLLDADESGQQAWDALVKSWIAKYNDSPAEVLKLSEAARLAMERASIEDIFDEDYYLGVVNEVYKDRLVGAGGPVTVATQGRRMIVKRVEEAFKARNVDFNHGTVAKRIRRDLRKAKTFGELPQHTQVHGRALIEALRFATER